MRMIIIFIVNAVLIKNNNNSKILFLNIFVIRIFTPIIRTSISIISLRF